VRAALIPLTVLAAALAAPAAAPASYGSAEQSAGGPRAAHNFVTAELNGDGAGACAILAARRRATVHHRTCAQRWDARLHALLRRPAGRAGLRRERAAIASATVEVRGDRATIALPQPLAGDSANRFLWTENCWMLTG
jgi:hypothetical protein